MERAGAPSPSPRSTGSTSKGAGWARSAPGAGGLRATSEGQRHPLPDGGLRPGAFRGGRDAGPAAPPDTGSGSPAQGRRRGARARSGPGGLADAAGIAVGERLTTAAAPGGSTARWRGWARPGGVASGPEPRAGRAQATVTRNGRRLHALCHAWRNRQVSDVEGIPNRVNLVKSSVDASRRALPLPHPIAPQAGRLKHSSVVFCFPRQKGAPIFVRSFPRMSRRSIRKPASNRLSCCKPSLP